ncbi:MAG: hypothetical protein E3J60_04190 [Dehalococcoidia bacterium]|nr:MAG: hypothetical protein E3J60_04190 [Dehalococcoidia bacterium]
MVTDYDFWKKAYQTTWAKTGKRTRSVADLIEEHTHKKVDIVGFGADSSDFISGSAESHGYDKGEADLAIKETNIHVEVTGTDSPRIHPPDPLYIRPDKIENARAHLKGRDTWVVHSLDSSKLLRAIKLDTDFFASYDSGKYPTIQRRIRGNIETFVSIPANDKKVQNMQILIDEIERK